MYASEAEHRHTKLDTIHSPPTARGTLGRPIYDKVEDTGCTNVEVVVSLQGLLHVLLVQLPVYLSSRPLSKLHSLQRKAPTPLDSPILRDPSSCSESGTVYPPCLRRM